MINLIYEKYISVIYMQLIEKYYQKTLLIVYIDKEDKIMAGGKLIENLAYEELIHICNLTEQIDFSGVKINEKGISWDGELIIYDSKQAFESGKKEGNERKVPIQLKGKMSNDNTKKDFGYSIDYKDLKNYSLNSGCLFLVVSIIPNGKNVVYYEILSKKYISQLINSRGIKKSYTISFRKISNFKDFYDVVLQAYIILNNRIMTKSIKIAMKNMKPNMTRTLNPSVKNTGDDISLIIETDDFKCEFE